MNSRKAIVWTQADLQQALAAWLEPGNIELAIEDVQGRIEAARIAGIDEGYRKGLAEKISSEAGKVNPSIRAEIAREERERVISIQGIAKAGFATVVLQAISEGWTAEKFALEQYRIEMDRGITLDAMRRDAPRPAAHARPGDDSRMHTSSRTSTSSADVFESRKQQVEASKP